VETIFACSWGFAMGWCAGFGWCRIKDAKRREADIARIIQAWEEIRKARKPFGGV